MILNQMKKLYLTWNKAQVADETIISDLTHISGGLLRVPEGTRLADSKALVPLQQKKAQMPGKQKKKQNKPFIKKKQKSKY